MMMYNCACTFTIKYIIHSMITLILIIIYQKIMNFKYLLLFKLKIND